MIDAYLDESGIHDGSAVCVIAGYFGLVHHWRPLEREWKSALKRHRFSMENFHAKDLVGRPKHEEMLMDLAKVIAGCRIYPVTDSIIVSDFFSFSQNQRKYLTGGEFCRGANLVKGGNPERPYFVPFQLILQKVTDYTAPTAKAHFTFGIDRTFYGYACSIFSKIKNARARPTEWQTKRRLGNAVSALAKETPELQTADLLSYLTYLHMQERIKPGGARQQPPSLLRTCLTNTKSGMNHTYQTRDSLKVTIPPAIFKALA